LALSKEIRARLHLSDEMQVYLSERAEKSHRSVNDEMVSILEESKVMAEHRPCIISIGLRPESEEIKSALEQLHSLFSYVDGAPFKGEFQVLCAGPLHGLSYDEAFILCQKKFFEVGWVYADAVQK